MKKADFINGVKALREFDEQILQWEAQGISVDDDNPVLKLRTEFERMMQESCGTRAGLLWYFMYGLEFGEKRLVDMPGAEWLFNPFEDSKEQLLDQIYDMIYN